MITCHPHVQRFFFVLFQSNLCHASFRNYQHHFPATFTTICCFVDEPYCSLTIHPMITSHRQMNKIIHKWDQIFFFTEFFITWALFWCKYDTYIPFHLPTQMTENFNGFSDESPNRQSPTARSRTSSQSNGKSSNSNRQTCGSNNHSSNGAGSPHSPLSNDSMLTGGSNYDNVNCDNLRSNMILESVDLNEDLLNGSSGNGVNDIMFGCGLGGFSDNKSNMGSLSNSNSLLMSQTSPSHHLTNVQTPTSIPSIVFSGNCWFSLFIKYLD